MRIGMIGLGRMGANMTRRLLAAGHEVVVHDLDPQAVARLHREGAWGAESLEELARRLEPPRAAWVMVPAGEPTAAVLAELAEVLSAGDAVVDGGNSRYSDTLDRAERLAARGIALVDAGVSGGIWGLEEGFCLMVGGEDAVVERLRPVFEALAPPGGFAHVGPVGSGHYVKMIHNGIEYALMQAYAEGFELLRASRFGLDLAQIAELWRHGSVIRSWLLDLAARALRRDPELAALEGYVQDSGEGRWTLQEALERAVPVPTIALSLFTRFASRQDESFAAKLLAALRHEFGGHPVKPADEQA
jgi:6-phosphogluconate dehydrogenase